MQSQKSFTIVELLVALAIFSLIVGSASGIFVSAIRAQRKALAQQELLDQTSYLMEYISRSVRMARKELSAPDCLSEHGLNYATTSSRVISGKTYSGLGLRFRNYQGICQEFFVDSQMLKEWKEGYLEPLPLTSGNLKVNSFNVNLVGQSQDDDLQPKVTVFFEIEGREQTKIKIQTSLSQRNPDIVR